MRTLFDDGNGVGVPRESWGVTVVFHTGTTRTKNYGSREDARDVAEQIQARGITVGAGGDRTEFYPPSSIFKVVVFKI